jgi:threonine dehydrogenase-like Zn-dependent dehydrogenase
VRPAIVKVRFLQLPHQSMHTMRALTVQPGVSGSLKVEEFRIPGPDRGAVLIRGLALGVCGTDRDIVSGAYGSPPPGHTRLIIGHESLGRVDEAPPDSGFAAGDLVVGIVRHPDPVPCANCAAGEWDMCRNGEYTEHGIKSLDGFGCEQYRLDPQFVVPVGASLGNLGVLVEPTSITAKAWEEIERIGSRALWKPERVLITGAGPVGLLAALLSVQRGLEVHVVDRVADGAKPNLVAALGATYHTDVRDAAGLFDVIIECTAVGDVIAAVLGKTNPNGIVCLAGVSNPGVMASIDLGAWNRDVVLGNRVVFGSVNANRRHYEAATTALTAAPSDWLRRLITRRVPLDDWRDAFEKSHDDIKTVITL